MRQRVSWPACHTVNMRAMMRVSPALCIIDIRREPLRSHRAVPQMGIARPSILKRCLLCTNHTWSKAQKLPAHIVRAIGRRQPTVRCGPHHSDCIVLYRLSISLEPPYRPLSATQDDCLRAQTPRCLGAFVSSMGSRGGRRHAQGRKIS